MSPINYSLCRLTAVLNEISRIKGAEFPYLHSKEALIQIEKKFIEHEIKIKSLSPGKSKEISYGFCSEALSDLFTYLPILGFILRSTNIRNAFEVYGPLLRIAQKVLGEKTRLILSSEWEKYPPFTYRDINWLPNYVLIGFPAPESSNPLLIPLAGHELGHTIWRSKWLQKKYQQNVELQLLQLIKSNAKKYNEIYPSHNITANNLEDNLFVKRTIAQPAQWALKQLEESFCDFIGYYLFDESYLHAFAYLISPQIEGHRTVLYPNILTRVRNLKKASVRFKLKQPSNYNTPNNYEDLFENMAEPYEGESGRKFLLSLADGATEALLAEMIAEAEEILSKAAVPILDVKIRDKILSDYKYVVPSIGSLSLTNILNASWIAFHDKNFWNDKPQMVDKNRALKELVLKNIEVLEIEQILKLAEAKNA